MSKEKSKQQHLEQQITLHKRAKVVGKKMKITKDAKLPEKVPKSKEAEEFLKSAICDNFIFSALDEHEMKLLIDVFQEEKFEEGSIIIQQGDVGDFFYVVEHGTVNFIIGDGQHVGSCTTGASFGELSLLYDAPRAATCAAATNASLWKVDQGTFRFLLAKNADSEEKKTSDLLREIPLFSGLGESTLIKFSNALTRVPFKQGECIVKKGDVGEVFYLIQEGKVKVHDIGFNTENLDNLIGPGEWFGERALLTGEPRAATCTAISDVITLAMDRKTFQKAIGVLEDVLKFEMKKDCLTVLPIISQQSKINPAEMNRLVHVMTEHRFEKGYKIAKAGKGYMQQLLIIRRGKISVFGASGAILKLSDGDQYGDQTIRLPSAAGNGLSVIKSTDTVVCDEDTDCYILTRDDIEDIIGDINRLGNTGSYIALNEHKSIGLKDIEKHRILGMGAFGLVWLTSSLETNEPYALKIMNKRELIDSKMVVGTIREKEILASLNHPFILPLISSFQDDEHLYLLLALFQGGELFNVIHGNPKRKRLPNDDARFYAACISDALGHFHERLICYRDLKPENILIDEKGYCIMIDLGFAKIVANKTYTLCGTPEYLAPEIITSKGHDKAVDWWAFGVLLYEMLLGRSPFFRSNADQITLFKNIVRVRYSVPDWMEPEAKDVLSKLLQKHRSQRLGNLARGHIDIMEHPYFTPIDFRELLERNIDAPWIPKVKDAFDASHFDSFTEADVEKKDGEIPNVEEQMQFDGF